LVVEHYALPKVQADWAASYLLWAVFAVVDAGYQQREKCDAELRRDIEHAN
jgi:hypothetical protein